jgi:TetR/AcrR family transcriptional repressor of nem operon
VLVAQECRHGCLIGNLSQEMSDQSELLRRALCEVMGKWRDMFAKCIEEGQAAGQINTTRSAHDLAEFFASGWSGAFMRAKAVKTTEALDVFIELMFKDILKSKS